MESQGSEGQGVYRDHIESIWILMESQGSEGGKWI